MARGVLKASVRRVSLVCMLSVLIVLDPFVAAFLNFQTQREQGALHRDLNISERWFVDIGFGQPILVLWMGWASRPCCNSTIRCVLFLVETEDPFQGGRHSLYLLARLRALMFRANVGYLNFSHHPWDSQPP